MAFIRIPSILLRIYLTHHRFENCSQSFIIYDIKNLFEISLRLSADCKSFTMRWTACLKIYEGSVPCWTMEIFESQAKVTPLRRCRLGTIPECSIPDLSHVTTSLFVLWHSFVMWNTKHGLAKVLAQLWQFFWVFVMGHSLCHGQSSFRWIGTFENSRSHEDAIDSKLHQQRHVSRGCCSKKKTKRGQLPNMIVTRMIFRTEGNEISHI